MTALKPRRKRLSYRINRDERGGFWADVYNVRTGKTVLDIRGGDELEDGDSSIFEDGFMRDKNDLSGLRSYLEHLGLVSDHDTLEND